MKIAFDQKILGGFAVCCIVLLAVALISFNNSEQVLESNAMVSHTYEVMYEFEQILTYAVESEVAVRGFVITNDEAYLQRHADSKSNIIVHLEKIRTITVDNPNQQSNVAALSDHVATHQAQLEQVILSRRKKNGVSMEESTLLTNESRRQLNEIRNILLAAKSIEQRLLAERKVISDESSKRFTIVFASLLLIIVIILTVMYFLVTTNIRALRRLESVASENNWILAGTENLMRTMEGDKTIPVLTRDILQCLANYVNAPLGSFYVAQPDNRSLRLEATFTRNGNFSGGADVAFGEGLAGQSAGSRRVILLENIEDARFNVDTSFGNIKPKQIIAFPFIVEDRVGGVIELGSLTGFSEHHQKYLRVVADSIALAIRSSIARDVVKNLLEETQQQALELERQSEELRQFNEELHAKTEMLEHSELELTNQQAELEHANVDLAEKATMLEKQKAALEEAKSEIERKAQQVELSSKYKSEFLANMSHELRTPLNSILILSQLMSENRKGNLIERDLEFANNIHSSGASLLNLINEILDLSKIEAGKMELDIEPCEVSTIVKTVREMVAGIAHAKSIHFNVVTDPQIEHVILNTDRQRVEQILRNLLSNAIKFTAAEGTVTLTVAKQPATVKLQNTSLRDSRKVIMFSVTDTGIGIPKEKHMLIFEAFQQADGSTKRKYGGTGLGLSISKELAAVLGGEIQLTSEEGIGSTFMLFLPMEFNENVQPVVNRDVGFKQLKPVSAAHISDGESQVDHAPTIDDDRNALHAQDKVILIIEDDEKFVKVLLQFIRERGYKGIVATQGNTGVNYARQFKPMAILLDVNLPVMDGNEVLRQVKNDPMLRHIPVQIISAYENKKQGLLLGAFDYLTKPVTLEELGDAFARIENFTHKKLKKLLIVEDDKQQNKVIQELIGGADVKILSAYSGEEAYGTLESEGADCIIVDLGLSEMSGFELMEKIRQNPRLKRIPIIVYTGKDLKKEDNARLNKLADTVVLKTANSPARLLDETILFLHRVESQLPREQQSIIRKLHKTDEILRDKKVLVVDDDFRNIYSLTNALEDEGIICITAENGKVALDIIKNDHSIDLVLMDVMMPEMDGYEATQEIRKIEQSKKLPIIALTAKAMKGDKEKCLAVGMSDYISKPVEIKQMLSLLRVWLYK